MTSRQGARVLVIEDDPSVRRIVTRNLASRGYRTEAATTGREGLDLDVGFHSDLILLDLGLPDMTGLDVISEVRARTTTPIVVLSVLGDEADKVRALDLGADDYLTKPFGVEELLARVRVALRHAGPSSGTDAVFHTGELLLDRERRVVQVGGKEIHLTPTEYALLTALASQPGSVLTDRALLQRSGDPSTDPRTTTCTCTWAACDESWRRIPPVPDTSAPRRGSAIASWSTTCPDLEDVLRRMARLLTRR